MCLAMLTTGVVRTGVVVHVGDDEDMSPGSVSAPSVVASTPTTLEVSWQAPTDSETPVTGLCRAVPEAGDLRGLAAVGAQRDDPEHNHYRFRCGPDLQGAGAGRERGERGAGPRSPAVEGRTAAPSAPVCPGGPDSHGHLGH